MSLKIFISAGEASGEHYGALLIQALQRQLSANGASAHFQGMGGERMVAAGLHRVVRSEDMAVMGITEVVRHLPRIYGEFRKLKKSIQTSRPDVAVLIDFPDIHFKLAKELHRLGVPVIFFVSPQLWAWKKKRIQLVQKYVSKMLVIFPFEEPFYQQRGVNAEFVGHPLADLPLPTIGRKQFARENGLDAATVWIGLLPGSRPKEIRDNLPEMLETAWTLVEHVWPHNRQYRFLIPLAATLNARQRAEVKAQVEAHGYGLPIRLVDDARAALLHARISIVASGTATVEAALIGNPFVVVYRVSRLTYAIAKRIVTVPHVAMANLIAGRRVVPELIQDDFRAPKIVEQIELLLPDGPPRESMMEGLREVGDLLRTQADRDPGPRSEAIDRVAAITLEWVRCGLPAPSPRLWDETTGCQSA